MLYARLTHPNDFIKQTAKTAVVQFEANHFTFLANEQMCHQPIIGASNIEETPTNVATDPETSIPPFERVPNVSTFASKDPIGVPIHVEKEPEVLK